MKYSEELFKKLVECLAWYVDNDDTNFGMKGNEFWEDGCKRAGSVLNEVFEEERYEFPEYEEGERYERDW